MDFLDTFRITAAERPVGDYPATLIEGWVLFDRERGAPGAIQLVNTVPWAVGFAAWQSCGGSIVHAASLGGLRLVPRAPSAGVLLGVVIFLVLQLTHSGFLMTIIVVAAQSILRLCVLGEETVMFTNHH